jgi:Tfp pilus assembly protein PilO
MGDLILASIIGGSSPFHNPGHLRMWYETPLRNFDPHLFTAIVVIIIVAGVGWFTYFQLKNRSLEEKMDENTDEKQFHDLVVKQKVILNKLVELEEKHKAGELSDEDYEKKASAYRDHLIKVKVQLQRFMD